MKNLITTSLLLSLLVSANTLAGTDKPYTWNNQNQQDDDFLGNQGSQGVSSQTTDKLYFTFSHYFNLTSDGGNYDRPGAVCTRIVREEINAYQVKNSTALEVQCQKVHYRAAADISAPESYGSSSSGRTIRYVRYGFDVFCDARDVASQYAYDMFLQCQNNKSRDCLRDDVQSTLSRWVKTSYDVIQQVAERACAKIK